jgi:hypothetical protein
VAHIQLRMLGRAGRRIRVGRSDFERFGLEIARSRLAIEQQIPPLPLRLCSGFGRNDGFKSE